MAPTIVIRGALYDALVAHLLAPEDSVEQVAFMYARPRRGDSTTFDVIDQTLIAGDGFVRHTEYHLELTDEARGAVIKRAHDLGASLAELHSHPFNAPAAFSPSDLAGLDEFVPHVWWRLAHRPYFAFVVGLTSFDALAWLESPRLPCPVRHLEVNGELLVPTGITLRARTGR